MSAAAASSGMWRGAFLSLAFWVSLLVAAASYAAVALAPKLVAWRSLSDRHQQLQKELLEREQQAEQLQRVVHALEHDPQFAAEVARLEFDALRPGEETIAVDGRLALQPATMKPLKLPERPASDAALASLLTTLANDSRLRGWLLVGAAALVVFGFTFLQDGETAPRELRSRKPSVWARWQRANPSATE